jgi:hypothetical protein
MANATYQLTMRAGPTPGRIIGLGTGESTIGRETSNAIAISDPEVSRRHVQLTFQNNYYILEDLNSTNGTFVNGRRLVGQYVLQPGDVINLGENVTLVFDAGPFDPDATQVTPTSFPQPDAVGLPPVSPPPQPPLATRQTAGIPDGYAYAAPAAPTEQLPGSPDDFEPMPIGAPRNRALPWMLAGCGCLTIVCVLLLAGLWYIDSNFLWCSTLPFLPGCP